MTCFGIALALGLALVVPVARAEDAAFTPAQRAEIVATMRAAMQADPSILRDAVLALQADEARARQAASRAAIAQATPALLATPADPVEGAARGDVTLVQFYDLRCPYCRKMLPTMAALVAHDPNLRIVDKDIPILGPASVLGARAVLAAQRQDGYAKLRDALMAGTPNITEDVVRTAALDTGLDWPRLRRDMDDPAIAARLEANVALAHSLGIDGTPAFAIGGKITSGAVPLAQLQASVLAARQPHG